MAKMQRITRISGEKNRNTSVKGLVLGSGIFFNFVDLRAFFVDLRVISALVIARG
jgi:hypothetical protein